MRNLIRSPLTWLLVAEFVMLGALGIVIWNIVATASRPVIASSGPQAPDAAVDASSPLPALTAAVNNNPQRGPRPGLNVDGAFWRERMAQLNVDQVALERLEWRIVHGAMDASKRYVETVVLPAVRSAEGGGG
jgi:poly(3-hydroxybutyrate) depolymerase